MVNDDPLFDAGWPESARISPPAQAGALGSGHAPAPGATDEEIVAHLVSQGETQDNARSYLRGWRQPK